MTRRNVPARALVLLLAVSGAGLVYAGPEKPLTAEDLARLEAAVAPTADFFRPEQKESLQAGAATSIEDPDRLAFSHFSSNLPRVDEMRFRLGNALFRKLWTSSPSSTQASDGLGPLFNARSCEQCHKDDGKGIAPDAKGPGTLFVRLARGPRDKAEEKALTEHLALNFPDETYGGQLQDKAVPGMKSEAQLTVAYTDQPFTYPDGKVTLLRQPTYSVTDLRYGPLGKDTSLSPRLAPAMIGLGLIESIDAAAIEALADPDDRDKDGISGRVQRVTGLDGKLYLGRFGWKAENPTVRDQTAHAFAGDLGISTPLVPRPAGDCTQNQADCLAMPNGEQARLGLGEASAEVLSLVTFYSRHLAVPARRNAGGADVLAGKKLFYEAGCTACHQPKFLTPAQNVDTPFRSQLIWPYSDFLLHDMGDGLADGQTVGKASGKEWRTPPLWAIGLARTVNGRTAFLHDGRARSLEEAILWHGGEAAASRNNFTAMVLADRNRLIAFLESL